jgi:hypothetical protein
MNFRTRVRQDPILLGTIAVMTLAIIVAVGLLLYWTLVLTPFYTPNPCSPKDAAWITTFTLL